MSQSFHTLRIAEKFRETPDAVSLVFDLPQELKKEFVFRAGQYITLKKAISNEEVRRSYSICASPKENILKINVKKVKGGRMSTWIVDSAEVGDTLEISIPEGNFVMDFDSSKRRNHYFITAGSGITPVMSLLKDGLEHEPMSSFVLLYGNKTEEHIIFKNELHALRDQFGEQFKLFFTLSQYRKFSGKLLGLLGKKYEEWKGWIGRIDGGKVQAVLEESPLHKIENHFYLCGPGEMITSAKAYLKAQSIPGLKIHKEYFTNPDQPDTQSQGSQATKLSYKNLHGENGEIDVPANKTLLDALMDAGVDPPYSCMNGVCSSCVAKLDKGKVKMDTCLALEDDEIEAGYILTCQSHALTDEIELHYEG